MTSAAAEVVRARYETGATLRRGNVRRTRLHPFIHGGASPRAQRFVATPKALAQPRREFATPDDARTSFSPVLRDIV